MQRPPAFLSSALALLAVALTAAACGGENQQEAADAAADSGEQAAAEKAEAPEVEPAPAPDFESMTREGELALLPESCHDIMGDPALLLKLSEAAYGEKNPALGYRYAVLIRQLHPESEEAERAWLYAAPALSRFVKYHRYHDRSPWIHTEPFFLLEWLADIVKDSEEFPFEEANLFFEKLPKSLRIELEKRMADHPIWSQYDYSFKMENGLIEYIRVRKKEEQAQTPS